MKLPIIGQCLCQAVKYEISEQPKRVGFCYCRSCQIKSGSGHLAYIAVLINAVKITGPVKWYQSLGDSGKYKQHGFCAECGSVLFGKPELWPHILAVYLGSLESPAEVKIDVNTWLQDMQPWDCCNNDLLSFDKNPQ